MKTLLLTAALALVSLPSLAAIQYDFLLKSTSEDIVTPTTDLNGRATIDGERSRVDFLGGNLYPPGTYVVSTDGSRRLMFVDPQNKWYTEFNAAGVASAIGASDIRIENLTSDTKKLPDTPMLAGVPTEHFQLLISYDITVVMKSIPLKQRVTTVIDSWTTTRFGDVVPNAFTTGMQHTGNVEIDKILELEGTKIKGLPLRQTVTTKTSLDMPSIKSQLKVPSTRTVTHETWVTAIREVPPDAALFTVPAGFKRADTPDLPKTAGEVVTFQPPPTGQ